MNLTIIGAGYVGLVTAAVFAKLGNEVWVVEIDNDKLKKLSCGEIPFYEPGLGELITKNTSAGKLRFTKSYKEAILGSEIIFVCVGTPSKNGKVDLSYVYSATKSVAENLKNPATIVIKSTVPPGINSKIEKWMKRFTKVSFDLASVPEFLREGKALEDSLHPYRVVIGVEKKSVAKKLLQLHKKIPGKRLVCNSASAQMIKYASNAYLPTKISFANSISILCDKFGAKVEDVMKGVGMDKRIGPDFLAAGLGYGGSCFPKDISALLHLSKKAGYNFSILKAVEKTNRKQVDYFVKKVVRLCGGSVKDKILVVLGLSFKPDTSDIRNARSLLVIEELQEKGAKIRACDPVAISEAQKVIKEVKFFGDPYEAMKGVGALILVTEWEQYKNLDFVKIKKLLKSPIVIDGWNVYNRKRLEKLGFVYEGIGK
ncbi:hypothetical protein COS54_03605 [Candidatus Shapirobacteria bacterium CG03_land_8_20_14_0_80_39_12]|uniref:UDP-glucose 6-dehydrogenase n=1 Tax=Candidatus Shapirobacteria bacterium CG03_land_8_20_14_0_80_39_12 TaxID=1974879 RepID=A0A2M7BAQ0_9BACT|nr:MAG: hypothetical protein COS54_03605 [Candidatus Shapirobacteria bacterium CG03_land_8_20_14_0_80_39_12]